MNIEELAEKIATELLSKKEKASRKERYNDELRRVMHVLTTVGNAFASKRAWPVDIHPLDWEQELEWLDILYKAGYHTSSGKKPCSEIGRGDLTSPVISVSLP
jgi:hypothetical protein